jgi:uncharacterized protein YjbI with pentapeptide repeats
MLHTSPRSEESRVDQQQQSRWRPTRRQLLWASGIVAVLALAVLVGYRYGITLWDWLQLLIVPAVIAGGGLWFNVQQREREQRIANERAQDEALQAYLDGVAQLLTDKEQPLHNAQPGDNLSTVARARTLTVLGSLDSDRKRSVLQFLYESGLIYKEQTLLNEADLIERRHNIVNLEQANLQGVYLRRAYLKYADLSGADLRFANLIGADLRGEANLIGANLFQAADLSEANLHRANLSDADLSDADLSDAHLTDASGIANEELEQQAASLEGATMPDGQKYEEWLKSKDRGEAE